MPIRVTCECGRQLQLADENLGKKVRCPVCKHIFTAQPPGGPSPAPATAIKEEPDTFSFAPGEEPSRDDSRRPDRPPRLADEVVGPRRRRTASGRTPSGEWAATRFLDPGAIVAVIAACIILFISIKEMRLSRASKDVPQTMTLASLIQNGPGDNAHVLLTDFIPGENYVFLYSQGKYEHVSEAEAVNRRWTNVYLPLIPLTPELRTQLANNPNGNIPALRPARVQVVVQPKGVNDKNSLEHWAAQMDRSPRLQGMVVNLTDSLDSKTRDLLRQSYPGTDFSQCWIVREGKTPTGPGPVLAGIGGGTLLIVLAGLWGICRFLFRNG